MTENFNKIIENLDGGVVGNGPIFYIPTIIPGVF
jgi:hypothetical protein